jgi:hypothetical protein
VYLSTRLFTAPEAVRAATAHEVTHLALQMSGLQSSEGYSFREEVRTELASVFLGFGEIYLCGRTVYAHKRPDERIGYMGIPELVRAYDRVHVLLGIDGPSGREVVAEAEVFPHVRSRPWWRIG